MSTPKRWSVAVLASGRGSNLQALYQASLDNLPIKLAGVFSDKANCDAIAYARTQHIPQHSFSIADFAQREAFDTALIDAVNGVQPQLIVCAGYMRLLSAAAIAHAVCPIINIHPSLLPLYPGLHTHARALADQQPEHGASVHLVNAVLDGGRVLSQVRVPVFAEDNAEHLAQRVLAQEHGLLIETIRALQQGRISLEAHSNAKVRILQNAIWQEF